MLHSAVMVTPIPSWIKKWDEILLQFYDFSKSPAYRLIVIITKICNLRCEAASASPKELDLFISHAILLDQEFDSWLTITPESWNYATCTAPMDHSDDAAYKSHYHIYYDLWTSNIWNTYRAARILLNLVIRFWIILASQGSPSSTMYASENACCAETLNHLSIEVCESVSYHLGTYPGCVDTPKALGGYFLVWPLFAVGGRPDGDPVLRMWVADRLEFVGRCMGIQQACAMAYRLRAM